MDVKDLAGVFRVQGKRFCVVVLLVLFCFLITVCDNNSDINAGVLIPQPSDEVVKRGLRKYLGHG